MTFTNRLLLAALACVVSTAATADPGDTTWVQTYTWEAQDNPATAYDSPGRRWFEFPSGDTTYRKILMYHRLKCLKTARQATWASLAGSGIT